MEGSRQVGFIVGLSLIYSKKCRGQKICVGSRRKKKGGTPWEKNSRKKKERKDKKLRRDCLREARNLGFAFGVKPGR